MTKSERRAEHGTAGYDGFISDAEDAADQAAGAAEDLMPVRSGKLLTSMERWY